MPVRRSVRYRRGPRDDIDDRIDAGPNRSSSGGAQGGQSTASGGARRPGSGRGTRSPLWPEGVPDDFTVLGSSTDRYSARGAEVWANAGRQVGGTRPAPIGARYFAGDEIKPASMGFASIVQRQRALVVAGWLAPDAEFTFGRWDKPTRDAYKELLMQANMAGLTAEQMLQQGVMDAGGGGGGGGSGGGGGGGMGIDPETGELIEGFGEQFVAPPLEVKLPNPDDLRAMFRNTSQRDLGIALGPDELNAMVVSYREHLLGIARQNHSLQVNRMRQEWEQGVQGTSTIGDPNAMSPETVMVDAPSMETYIDDKLRTEHTGKWQTQQGLNLLLPMIQSWGGMG